jgi:hypothetical protein
MSSRIIYKNQDNSVSVLIPTSEALSFATIYQIAEKDVPHNIPYWIVSTSDIPESRTFRNAWEVDESFGEPDGFGGESNEFDEELLRKYYEVKDADKN